MRSCLEWKDTMIPNEFIDRFMAAANGEYVKVYLYMLRHQGRITDVGRIADDLNHTEADIRRALNYWVKQGVLAPEGDFAGETAAGGIRKESRGVRPEAAKESSAGGTAGERQDYRAEVSGEQKGREGKHGSAPMTGVSFEPLREEMPVPLGGVGREAPMSSMAGILAGSGAGAGMAAVSGDKTPSGAVIRAQTVTRKTYTPEQVSRLADQEDFTQLLYISQKYMNKVFTPRECEVFAYLYDGLCMSPDLLEYLVEYCVQGGHYSIRYLESVALNWHEKGIRTVDKAKEHTAAFNKDGFAVMKAFGINDRRPGEAEQEMISKWFREFGFTRDIVLEACSRTLKAIHKPSFSYADKILSEWKKGGVRILSDVEKMDERRESRRAEKAGGTAKPAKNQFHNFEQRSTDYDAMVLERLKERLGEQ